MHKALEQASIAQSIGEVPVGAVVVKAGRVIGEGRHRRCGGDHAEVAALKSCKVSPKGATVYVTLEPCSKPGRVGACCDALEPCPMCAGAIINSRIRRVVFGAYDKKAGSCGSIVNLFELPYNHKPDIKGGVLENECSDMLKNFFKELRLKRNK